MADSGNCFAMIWKIRNFSMCTQKSGDGLQSPPFKEDPKGTHCWNIGVYPKGIDKETYVSVELSNKVKECDFFHFTVSIIGRDGTPQFSKEISTTPKNVTQRVRISKFIKRSDLFHQKESLLPCGVLTLQCVVRKPYKLVEGYQDIKSYTQSFVWNIKNFGDSIESITDTQQFTFSGLEKAPKCAFSFRVKKLSPEENREQSTIFQLSVTWTTPCPYLSKFFAVNDSEMTRTFVVGGEHLFHSNTDQESFSSEPVRIKESTYIERGFLIDGTLSLLAEMKFSDGSLSQSPEETDITYDYLQPKPKVSPQANSWEKIYQDMKFCDIVIKVGTESLSAHRAVLGIWSDVFEAMFDHDMTEKRTNIVNITDIEADAMKYLLKLFYTGKIDDDLSYEDVLNLYVAAHKYQVKSLQTVSSVLTSKITKDNVWEVLRTANFYDDDALKTASKTFIMANKSPLLDMMMSDFQTPPSSSATNPEINIGDGPPFKKRRL